MIQRSKLHNLNEIAIMNLSEVLQIFQALWT